MLDQRHHHVSSTQPIYSDHLRQNNPAPVNGQMFGASRLKPSVVCVASSTEGSGNHHRPTLVQPPYNPTFTIASPFRRFVVSHFLLVILLLLGPTTSMPPSIFSCHPLVSAVVECKKEEIFQAAAHDRSIKPKHLKPRAICHIVRDIDGLGFLI